jgi:hypothetical protein
LGVVSDQSLPVPGIFILLTPIIVFVSVVLVRSPVGGQLASCIPLALLIGLQAFRIGVELTLHRLWELVSVPKLMTLGSGNVEIRIGLSAPLFAWVAACGSGGRRIALVWNVVGLVSLLNVVARAVLTAPGPLNLVHRDVLNTALSTLPYTFIPGFMAPLAMMLHVLTFRALRAKSQLDKPAFAGSRPPFPKPLGHELRRIGMTDTIDIGRAHYNATGLTARIRDALLKVAPEEQLLTVADIAAMDQFHTRGMLAARDLAAMTNKAPDTRVLDLGCGIGGPARFLAATFGCHLTGLDLSESFIEAARYLTDRCAM